MQPELEDPFFARLDAGLRGELRRLWELLWEASGEVDAAERIPAGHFGELARAGLYGLYAPRPEGGLGLGYREACAVVEHLASACLSTTFVWAQHLRFLNAMLDSSTPTELREQFRAAAVRGDLKAGVALTGLMPGPPRLFASREGGFGWRLHGEAPWVSGWGTVEVLLVVARLRAGGEGDEAASERGAGPPGAAPPDEVVTLVLDAREQEGLQAVPVSLSALNATRTVRLLFDGCWVARDRWVSQMPYVSARAEGEHLRLNGSFALGLAKRCCMLIGPSPLDDELRRCREQLDAAPDPEHPTVTGNANPAEVPKALRNAQRSAGGGRRLSIASARAATSELALRAAHALAVSQGSRSALAGDVAERSSREANLLLVFGTRPAIREALLVRLGALEAGWHKEP